MEANSPVGILFGLAVVGVIVGAVVYDSALTFGEAFGLALQYWWITAPLVVLVVLAAVFSKGGSGGGGVHT